MNLTSENEFYKVLLSPILFDIYINDLLIKLQINKATHLVYADDIAAICHGRNILKNIINTSIFWCHTNYMELNKNKSGIFHLKREERNLKE